MFQSQPLSNISINRRFQLLVPIKEYKVYKAWDEVSQSDVCVKLEHLPCSNPKLLAEA